MTYRIKHNQFCALSKEEKFQLWLAGINSELYDELIKHLETYSSCASNRGKMIIINRKLEDLGLKDKLMEFLKEHYPLTIEYVDEKSEPEQIIDNSQIKVIFTLKDDIIFPNYYPNLLTFPQKMVVQGPPQILETYVKNFIADKINCDYIIIGDKAYIEYFCRKYKQEAAMVKPESRDIFKYKQRSTT